MIKAVTEADSYAFYLGHQIVATLILAGLSLLIGLFFAWIFWGQCKNRVAEIQARNRQLKSELQDLEISK